MRATSSLAARIGALLGLAIACNTAFAVQRPLDTTSPLNGLTDIVSFTFDGSLQNPFCVGLTGFALRDCQFFIGVPSPTRAVVVAPNPTGVANIVPGGIAGAGSGSFLDLTLNANQTQVTLAGGTVAFPSGLTLNISGTTIVNPSGIAGFVIDPAPVVAPVDANGVAEIRVDLNGPIAADFSTFNDIVIQPGTDCVGPQCVLIPILTLDMLKYRLLIDFDPSFSTFTASFVGQGGNSSLVIATLNSGRPEIAVTDSVAPADDLQVPFGNVTELASATQTVTVTNTGGANLLLGAVGLANPLAAPFALANDNCTGATVLPAASCTFNVTFSPGSVGAFSDSVDIPSNDADEPSVTVSVSGSGTAQPVPNISVTDSVPPTTDQLVPFGSATVGSTVNETVTVSNEGNADLVLGSVAVANALAAPFSIVSDTCSGQTVAPAASCTLGVRFQPTSAGALSDSFDIPSNDAADPTVTVGVSGTGTAVSTPGISVTDDTLPEDDRLIPFGNVTEGTERIRTVTVTSVGDADLLLGAIAVANPLAEPFSLGTDTCSAQTLAPAARCTVTVIYSPATTITSSDSLNIPSNDPDDPTVTVSVTGTGITLGEGGVGTPSPSGADSGFMAVDPATLALLGAAGVWGWRRRRAQ